jgi:lipoyl(octanoyl) transferase
MIEVIEAGVVPYAEALAWQRRLAEDRIARRLDHDVLVLLEHPPVVTLGRNSHAAHLLEAEGIEIFEVERGGDVTFHGPGQLVGYPILDLRDYKQDLHWYLRTLEQALIGALAELEIPTERKPGFTGVWTRAGGAGGAGARLRVSAFT